MKISPVFLCFSKYSILQVDDSLRETFSLLTDEQILGSESHKDELAKQVEAAGNETYNNEVPSQSTQQHKAVILFYILPKSERVKNK